MKTSTTSKRSPRRRTPAKPNSTITVPISLACKLDRNADALLFLGCHVAAERLALRAQTLREAGASA